MHKFRIPRVRNKKSDNNSVNKTLRKLRDTVPELYTTGGLDRITRERPAPMTACQYCGVLYCTRPKTDENYCKRRQTAAAAASEASHWSKTTVFYLSFLFRLLIIFVLPVGPVYVKKSIKLFAIYLYLWQKNII
jgi:hypothetical protein